MLYPFGPYYISRAVEVFYSTKLTLAVVNLRPVAHHHVLVFPRRPVARFADLVEAEVADLWLSAQRIGSRIEAHGRKRGVSGLQFVIQDGVGSGQTVPHVHVHIVPRTPGDFTPNDAIYGALEKRGFHADETERPDRSRDEMREERDELAALFPEAEYQVP
ncbi:bis(5'-adenosyl)-triphosphatase [Cyanidioschyzon merolae strain 10D]|jgi:bis(5'-adenosyl)-triphosphatase|uniref:Bis(5'-adenosyl)-triphosphatase n=1 Tax=Cyanidioschyzon merolae (strain NIES-3377 / 10D) TaxID=280699 RepID=M1UNS7_CYAM1|nr:bis(5'-adenosyl)-triphosphatase [Cyanidioschyzon merolae strain 10D]BAM79066.1 bis(5'-adenosyl)-triphosphatase [Cyanidioschyzon merolae strain 10D]|eukprot:XP_005535352.1 bis(5'-adenosyl)-triphosphatase [Cyanidioschyzon merolae strain 10D]